VDRREFLAATAVAAVLPVPRLDALGQSAPRQYIELRRYHLLPGTKQRAFIAFIGDAAIPAMNRAGIGLVGAFTVVYGENAPSLLLVLPHRTLDSVVSMRERLASDAVYARDGAAILDVPMSDPAFVRVESTLLRSIDSMPTLEPSPGAGKAPRRIFELRTYESHSDRAALNKLRRAGLTPIFFGETVIGGKMPSLTYMLSMPDMPARDAAWSTFGQDAEWKTLSADPQYRDNVSAISDIILQPTSYSQI